MPRVSTRVEVFEPGADEPIAGMTVPGTVTVDAIRKELRVGITIIVNLGDKRKKKTFTLEITDPELRERLEEYVDSLSLVLTEVEYEERTLGEYRLADVKTAEA